jgi:hypothetical protein
MATPRPPRSWRRKPFTAVLTGIIAVMGATFSPSVTFSLPPMHLASGLGDGCPPNRAADHPNGSGGHYNRFAGLLTGSQGSLVGAVYAKILNYSPWVDPNQSYTDGNFVTSWVLLDAGPYSGASRVQIGWIETPYAARETWMEISEPNGPAMPDVFRSAEPTNANTYYTIFDGNTPGRFTFQVSTSGGSNYMIDNGWSANFAPYDAQVAGETTSLSDQMAGDLGVPGYEMFADAEYYIGSGFTPFSPALSPYLADQAGNSDTAYYYGMLDSVSGRTNLRTWDWACPHSDVGSVAGVDSHIYVVQGSSGSMPFIDEGAAPGGHAPWVAAPAVTGAPGTQNAYYIATANDGTLWVRNDSTGWQSLSIAPTNCFDNPGALIISSTLYVECAGPMSGSHSLWYATASMPAYPGNPTVSGWASGGGGLGAGPALSSVNGALTTFVTAPDHTVWSSVWGSGTWSRAPWGCVGHPAVASVGSRSVFACQGLDGTGWVARNDGTGWANPFSVGGALANGPGIAVGAGGDATLYAEGNGPGNSLYATHIPWGAGGTGWVSLPGGLVYGVGSALMGAN